MSSQGTIRLKVTNDAPSIEKLWNGRFRLEFLCDNNSPKTDWYSENISSILPDYGILQDTNFGSGVSEDWKAIPASVYPDMRLVETEYVFIPSMGDKRVKLTYETLTDSWVEEKDEDTDYELNGLKRVSRTFVALPGTVYDKVVGTSTIDSNGTTLYLGSFKIEETDAKWSLSESWLEAGELSREENSEDAKGSISITQIGGCPAAPAGYTVVNESKNNTQGFETCSRTFYKDDSELSRGNDYIGSQLAETIEVFSPTVAPTPTNGIAVLGNKSTSNVDGIPTTRYTFLKPSILSESEDKVGSQKSITIEAFSLTPDAPESYVLAGTRVSDVAGIPTSRFTFLKDEAVLSRNIQTKNGGKLILEVVEVFNGTPIADTADAVQIGNEVSDVDGIPTRRFTFAKGDGQIFISQSAGPNNIPGTTQRTIRSLGVELVPDGVLIDSQDIVRDGYIEYIRTTLDGTIEGVKTRYADVATVEVPGTVDCTTQAVSAEGVGGTIAITNSTPRRQKQVQTQVTVEITTSPPTAAPRAYDLGQISCSVTSVQVKLQSGDGSVATAVDGSTTLSQVGFQKSFASSASIQHYVGSYLTSAYSSGSVSYQSSEQPYLSAPNAISVQTAFSSASSSCTGTGATAATGYSEVGVISRTVNVVLTALDGTTYYQVVTEETL